MDQVEIVVFEQDRQTWQGLVLPPIEVGRQQEGDLNAPDLQDQFTFRRLVVAPLTARSIPRQALRVEWARAGCLRVINIHPRLPLWLGNETMQLPPGAQFESTESFSVLLPDQRRLLLRPISNESRKPLEDDNSVQYRTLAIQADTQVLPPTVRLRELLEESRVEQRGRAAVDLVRSALEVVRQAAGSNEFFDAAVHAAAEMIELDRALVLLREGSGWNIRATFDRDPSTIDMSHSRSFSESLITRVLTTGQTAIFEPSQNPQQAGESLMLLDRAVASPLYDKDRRVVGVLYGDRKANATNFISGAIGDLEAALFEVLAGAVSSGLARQQQEAIRVSLSQFFSPHVAERLEADQSLLLGHDAEVSVLFCDIRGFSAVTERVGPGRTIEWINDVLTELSQCVMRQDGVLVDYIGDELMAMFGAPGNQSDHARRACRAACEMLRHVKPLRDRWKEILPEGFGVGIGINTGQARVGNTGSRIKFKYGPLGNTVNVASRVQGVTKQIGASAIITAATARALEGEFAVRRLAQVRTLGIQEAVTLYELAPDADARWLQMKPRYEAALEAFEMEDLTTAARLLAALLEEFPDDRPSLLLLGRVVDRLTHRSGESNAIWVLDKK